MDRRKIVAALALFITTLAFIAPAEAQTVGTSAAAPAIAPGSSAVPTVQSNKDLMGALIATKETSMAASVMKKGSLESLAAPGGKYTLFVASDTALKAASPDVTSAMMEKLKDQQFAIYFVKGHLANGMIMPGSLTAEGKAVTMMNGATLMVRMKDGRMMADDAMIVRAIEASNGVIFEMDRIPSSIQAMIEQTGVPSTNTGQASM